tara:strand:+ start:1316 stop:4231 length:2916 start_codon:yes stop_codon:yes gene_type:complete
MATNTSTGWPTAMGTGPKTAVPISSGTSWPTAMAVSNNKKLTQIATAQQSAQLAAQAQAQAGIASIPQLPVQGAAPTGNGGQDVVDDFKRKLAPIYNPVLEVMNATNANFLGSAWDLTLAIPRVAEGLYNKATTGELDYPSYPRPEQLTNLQYVPNAEDADILDKGAFYASLGVGMSAAAQKLIGSFGQSFTKATTATTPAGSVYLKARPTSPTTPVAGKRENLLRDIGSVGMTPAIALTNEVGIGAAATLGGEVGKAQDVKVLGYDVLQLPFELAFGIGQSIVQAPRQAAGLAVDAFTKKYGEIPMAQASQTARQTAQSPLEATIALERNATSELLPDNSVAIKTEDPGILTLERANAAKDPIFAQSVNESVDLAQASLARELESFTDPATGELSYVAFEKMLPKIQDDILKQVDDRVTLAQEELATTLRIHEGDPVQISREFSKTIDEMFDDFAVQEANKWAIVNNHVVIPTQDVRKEIIDIVNKIPKTANVPVKILERLTGGAVVNTNNGWKVTFDPKVAKQPKVKMLDQEAPSILKDERSNLTTISRNNKKTDRTADQFNEKVLQDVQVALLRGLTDGVTSISPELQKGYLDALDFTKLLHSITTKKGSSIPQVKKAQPEKRLETLLKGDGASQSDMAVAARELEELTGIVSSDSSAAVSKSLKNAEQYLLDRFSRIDSTDIASFEKFQAVHKDWFARFPEIGEIVAAAKLKAKSQGAVVKDAEAAAAAARLNKFSAIAGKSPAAMITHILNQANPVKSAVKFRKLLGKDKVALQEFKDYIGSQLAAKALKEVDNQVAGSGTQKVIKPVSFNDALKELGPLVKVFNTEKEMQGLKRLYNHSVMVSNSIQAKRGAGPIETGKTNTMNVLAAKIVALKAVNFFAGSQSIVLANTASNAATRAVNSLSQDVAESIVKEGLRNDELMKILLSPDITTKQLSMLNSDRFQTGRMLFKALTEIRRDETVETTQ